MRESRHAFRGTERDRVTDVADIAMRELARQADEADRRYRDLLGSVRRYLAARDATGQVNRGTRADAERVQRAYYEALQDLQARAQRDAA
jgi:hypothetical protein